jgi:hypothetical protein
MVLALRLDVEGFPMEKLIGFAFIAAAIVGAALAQPGSVSKESSIWPKADLAAPAANPAPLPFQILKPLY